MMDRTERFYLIERMLRSRHLVTTAEFLETLEVSRATLKRDLEYLRSRLSTPIVWDADSGGYRLGTGKPESELPGLWFGAAEAHALLAMHQLLEQIGAGMLESHVAPMAQRLERILGSRGHAVAQVRRRIRLLQMARRPLDSAQFAVLAQALLERRRLSVLHFNRASGEQLEREVSPQRLVYYRDNWYLDAWCHRRNALRSFAVDAVAGACLLDSPAEEVGEDYLDRELASGYGIFSGAAVHWATLRFTAARARWVASEQWHPAQRAHFDEGGNYLLELPYSDERELLMDVLKHGAEVEVLAPVSLRERLAQQLRRTLARYEAGEQGGSSPEPWCG
jgi:predicted DNA-binding transcriptional regulator YafY